MTGKDSTLPARLDAGRGLLRHFDAATGVISYLSQFNVA
ncbi:hypothetical protein B0G83_10265 [Paraburkholderia sp. BL21I4N1]|nr:hypothetical protein B0G83_10265 [Paraburkholderia sp. BL21I4N1]